MLWDPTLMMLVGLQTKDNFEQTCKHDDMVPKMEMRQDAATCQERGLA